MAILKFGTIVTGARGTIGGMVLSQNKAGPYAKAWRMPTKKPNSQNNFVTTFFAAMGYAWNNLTSTQRGAWDTWAADPAQEKTNPLGEAYYLSGWQSYVSINLRLIFFLRGLRTAPPTSTQPTAPGLTSLAAHKTGSGSNTTLSFASNTFSTVDFFCQAALVNSVGINDAAPTWIVLHRAYPFAGSTIDLQTQCESKFGILQVGQKLLLRVNRQDTQGMRSAASTIEADIAA